MKRILIITALTLFCGAMAFAQEKKAVAEKEVNVAYVKDFQRQIKNATNIEWYQIDEVTYEVRYFDSEKSRQAMVFNNKGSETYYYIDKQYIPAAIKETVANLYPKYKVQDCWVRKARGKMTYQAAIAKVSGFLFWKKATDPKTLNFEVDGTFINAE